MFSSFPIIVLLLFSNFSMSLSLSEEPVNFENFNNETGVDYYLVPNIVHFVRMNQSSFTFGDYICVLAAFLNQDPDVIYFHTNTGFEGKYWNRIVGHEELFDRIRINPIEIPKDIFGQDFSQDNYLWHASDVVRIRTLMKYGGIYLDNDMYIVQNLDNYRKFEFVIGLGDGNFMGTQLIVAHKDARFLSSWLELYREYIPHCWYCNAGEKPTKEIILKHPEILHLVLDRIACYDTKNYLYKELNKNWKKDYHAIHTVYRGRWCEGCPGRYAELDEKLIKYYKTTYSEMALDVLNRI